MTPWTLGFTVVVTLLCLAGAVGCGPTSVDAPIDAAGTPDATATPDAAATPDAGGADAAGCLAPGDCPGVDDECQQRTCAMGVCGVQFAPNGTALVAQVPADCKVAVCDGAGAMTTAAADTDVGDDGNECTADGCTAGTPTATPLAAGTVCAAGLCDGAGGCKECLTGPDCASGVCQSNVCVPATCGDLVQNGAETDVDCGGPDCGDCADGDSCAVAGDCASGVCGSGSGVCEPPTCVDGVRNSTEADVDCGGGVCPPCALGATCTMGSDCASAVCGGGTCVLSVCGDGLVTGTEQCEPPGTMTCSAGCMLNCGDGTLQPGEACDDGNTVAADGCEADCQLVCGAGTGAVRATLDTGNGHCYLGFAGAVTWQSAETACQGLAGHLVSIASAAENTLARTASVITDAPWIGGHDTASEGNFVWVDGAPFTFNQFEPGQPDDSFGNEDCLHFFDAATSPTGAVLTWNDTNCDFVGFVTGHICEVAPPVCGDGFQQAAVGELCDDGNTVSHDGCSATCVAELILNEVDYDQIGTDTGEFVELLNTSAVTVDLADFALVFVNGSAVPSPQYRRQNLSSTLAPGQYAVVATTSITVAPGTLRFDFPSLQDNVQNGAPDGVGLFRVSTGQLVDALSYEGAMTMCTTDFGTGISLVEGTALPVGVADSNTVVASLARLPNATDTDNAATDWALSLTPTPGAANTP